MIVIHYLSSHKHLTIPLKNVFSLGFHDFSPLLTYPLEAFQYPLWSSDSLWTREIVKVRGILLCLYSSLVFCCHVLCALRRMISSKQCPTFPIIYGYSQVCIFISELSNLFQIYIFYLSKDHF